MNVGYLLFFSSSEHQRRHCDAGDSTLEGELRHPLTNHQQQRDPSGGTAQRGRTQDLQGSPAPQQNILLLQTS